MDMVGSAKLNKRTLQLTKALVFLITGGIVQLLTPPAHGITLEWDPPNSAAAGSIAGYRVYYGPNSCRGVGNCQYPRHVYVQAPAIRCVVADVDLTPNATNYFTITAVGYDGTESSRAEEIDYFAEPPPPNPIADLLANLTKSVVVGAGQVAPVPVVDTEEIVQNGVSPGQPNPGEGIVVPALGPVLDLVPVGKPVVAVLVQFDAPANKSCELQYNDGDQVWRTLLVHFGGNVSERTAYYDSIMPARVPRRFYRLIVH